MPTSQLREPTGPISEADLSSIWQGQRYPPGALSGPGGEAVTVLYPGRKGGGPGPDFRDAVVRVGGEERIGDVELHVRATSYQQHGHHLDPAYDRVVLHVVFEDDGGGATSLACGERVPIAAFAPWVTARSADIAAWLQAPPLWSEPCRGAAARLGPGRVAEEVRAAGVARFRGRGLALSAAVAREGPDEALWQAILDALGYGGDRDGFRRLGRALPAALLSQIAPAGVEREDIIFAALLAVAGLAPAPDLASRLPPPLAPALRPLASRPANRPERRLAAAAAIFAARGGSLSGRAAASVAGAGDAASLIHAWSPRPRSGAAIGAARASELLLNAVLPFVAATVPELSERCLALAAALPALPPYGKTRFLEDNLRGEDNRRPVRAALDQQGLLGLQAEWCSRGGCGRCPLS